MAYNGSGIFNLYTPGNPVVTGTTISSTWANNTLSDIATGLSTAITKDGQTTITANIPMSTYKFTGLGNGSARTDSANLANVQDGTGIYVGTVGGTADVITLTPSPAITAYSAGQTFRWIASGANTTNVTVNVSGLGAKALTKNGSTALVAGDLPSGAMITATYDGTRFQLVSVGAASYAASGAVTTSGLTMATSRILGRTTASTGAVEELTVGAGLSLATGSLAAVIIQGHLSGCRLSNNVADATNDIDIAAGQCVDSTNAVYITVAAMTKRLDANWSAGTGNGMRYSGAAITDTTYHIWAVSTAAGTQDIYATPNASASTASGALTLLQAESGGASYVYARRIGSIIRSSGAILAFLQTGQYFMLQSPVNNINGTNLTTANRTSVSTTVPLGFKMRGIYSFGYQTGAALSTMAALLTDPDNTDVAAGQNTGFSVGGSDQTSTAFHGNYAECFTNTSAQVGTRGSQAYAYYLNTHGWFDATLK